MATASTSTLPARRILSEQHQRLADTLSRIQQFQAAFANLDTRTEALDSLSNVLHSITANEPGFRTLNSLLKEIKAGAHPELKNEARSLESVLVQVVRTIDDAERLAVEAKSRLTPELRSDVLGHKMRTAYASRQR